MFVVPIPVTIMPIGVTVFVIFAVPVPFVVAPTIGVVVVVWVAPKSSRIGWLFVAAGNPAIVMSLGCPEARNPYHLGRGRRWRRFIADGRRSDSNGDGNLTGRRKDERQGKKESASTFHVCLHRCAPLLRATGVAAELPFGIHT
jgi:hypothetical protein